MKTRNTATIIILFCALICSAQVKEVNIAYENGSKESAQIFTHEFFYKNKLIASNKKEIPIEDISSIELGDRIYYKKEVALHRYQKWANKELMNLTVKDSILFLDKIVDGSINLYRFRDKEETVHWFIENDNNIEELVNMEYTINGNELVSQKRYISTLYKYLEKCKSTNAVDYQKIQFSETSLKDVVKKVNNECGKEFSTSKRKKSNSFRVGVILGGSIQQSNFDLPFRNKKPTEDCINCGSSKILYTNPVLGAYLQYQLSKSSDKTAIITELAYIGNYSFYSNTQIDRYLDTTRINSKYNADYIGFGFNFRYTHSLNKSSLKLFFEPGVYTRQVVNIRENETITTLTKTSTISPEKVTIQTSDAVKKRDYPIGLLSLKSRVGIIYNKFDLGFAYEQGRGGITSLSSESHRTYFFDLRYRIF